MAVENEQTIKRGPGRPKGSAKRGPGRPRKPGNVPESGSAFASAVPKKRGPKPGKKRGPKPGSRSGGGLVAKAVAKQLKALRKEETARTAQWVKSLVSKELKRALKKLLA